MKPFLLLQHRQEDAAHQQETDVIIKFSGLTSQDFVSVRMNQEEIPELDFSLYSGVIISGGPWNTYPPDDEKSIEQRRAEEKLKSLIPLIVEQDIPLLAICYGMEILVVAMGGSQTHDRYAEAPGGTDIVLTEEGKKDTLLQGLPDSFRALVGHKEATDILPRDAVCLAQSEVCPYQIIRLKENIYAVQFHPELDVDGICFRIDIYKNAGYFPPEDAKRLKDKMQKERITIPMQIIKRFVDRYHQ